MWGGVHDVINCDNFCENCSRGLGAGISRKTAFPIESVHRPYNSVSTTALHCDNISYSFHHVYSCCNFLAVFTLRKSRNMAVSEVTAKILITSLDSSILVLVKVEYLKRSQSTHTVLGNKCTKLQFIQALTAKCSD